MTTELRFSKKTTWPTNIVAIAANGPQNGKSTVAWRFTQAGYTPLSFAAPGKNMLYHFMLSLGIDSDRAYTYLTNDKVSIIPEIGVNCRTLLTTLLGDWARDTINPTVWLTGMREQILKVPPIGGVRRVVIDDLRYPNEYAFLKGYTKATYILVVGPNENKLTHSSEGALANHRFDFTIYNDGTEAELITTVEEVIKIC